jgi:hypothetical protein
MKGQSTERRFDLGAVTSIFAAKNRPALPAILG